MQIPILRQHFFVGMFLLARSEINLPSSHSSQFLQRLILVVPSVSPSRICCGTTTPSSIVSVGASATPSPPHPMVLMVTWKKQLVGECQQNLPGGAQSSWDSTQVSRIKSHQSSRAVGPEGKLAHGSHETPGCIVRPWNQWISRVQLSNSIRFKASILSAGGPMVPFPCQLHQITRFCCRNPWLVWDFRRFRRNTWLCGQIFGLGIWYVYNYIYNHMYVLVYTFMVYGVWIYLYIYIFIYHIYTYYLLCPQEQKIEQEAAITQSCRRRKRRWRQGIDLIGYNEIAGMPKQSNNDGYLFRTWPRNENMQ